MARARNLKPGFFKNEELAECSAWARLCFAGLWTLADREGRLEDRPKRIKGELFAFDSVDVDDLLDELKRHGFIVRYHAGDIAAIQILHFLDHQAPHYSEKPSAIMGPPFAEHSGKSDRINGTEYREDSGNQPAIKRGAQRPSSLNPSSLNPDSLNPSLPNPFARATPPGEACKAMRDAGIADTNPNHPDLIAMLAQGMTVGELVSASVKAVNSKANSPFNYALTVARSEREKLDSRGALPARKVSPFALPPGHVRVLPDDLPDLNLHDEAPPCR